MTVADPPAGANAHEGQDGASSTPAVAEPNAPPSAQDANPGSPAATTPQVPREQDESADGQHGQVPSTETNSTLPTSSEEKSSSITSKQELVPVGKPAEKEKYKTGSSSLRGRSRRRNSNSKPSPLNGKSAVGRTRSKEAGQATKRRKVTFFERITFICTSCVSSSPRTHDVDIDEGATHVHTHQEKKDPEKQSVRQETTEDSIDKESPTSTISKPEALTVITTIPLVDPDVAVLVPPTPTKQLLPVSETDGLTSGAVQPPGSTGEENKPVVHIPINDSDEYDSSSDDEAFMEVAQLEEWEDEEQRLIKQGGTGIPRGPDGIPRPLLPPLAPKCMGKKCLVLDLDETLVHSSLKPVPSPDYIVPVEIEGNWHNFYVLKRPGVDAFMRRMGEIYEVVVFTASLAKYADPVLDRLDPTASVAHRLFRESCFNHRGNYVKDLSQLGRSIEGTIILDNSPASYIFHPYNAVPVSSWFNDPHDTELTDLTRFLEDLADVPDVRGILNPAVEHLQ